MLRVHHQKINKAEADIVYAPDTCEWRVEVRLYTDKTMLVGLNILPHYPTPYQLLECINEQLAELVTVDRSLVND